MKGKLFIGILITVLIFGCDNPFFPEKDVEETSGHLAPVITGHPQGAVYAVGDTTVIPLTVTAVISGNGQLSYKWYSNDIDSNQDGTEIPGETEASYIPSAEELGTTYYYAKVTNTLNGQTASAVSNTARIIVSDIPPIGGSAQISGTYKIGGELSIITTGITGAEAPFKYQWRQDGVNINDATEAVYTIQSANVAKVISCVISHNAVPGSVTADGEKVPYTIEIVMREEEPGDTVTADPDTGHEDDEITIAFTVADIYHYNLLDFGGVTPHIDSADSKGSGTRIYIVNPADASEGVINIIATFKHTDLVPDHIAFTNEDHVTGIYGEEITNAVKAGHLGSGVITYSSDDEEIAVVDNNGKVTLRRAGTAIITAHKDADTVYSHASKSYTLTVAPKPLTISAGAPARTLIPFDAADTNYGSDAAFNITISGLLGADTVTVNIVANTLGVSLLDNAGVGSAGKSVTLSYDGTAAAVTMPASIVLYISGNDNYTLSGMPAVSVTVIDGVTSVRAIPVTQNNITAFNAYANTAPGLTRHYKLTQNVTLTPPATGGNNWTAIGSSSSTQFSGSFDGQLFTINNLTIDRNADYQGMFGYIDGGIVQSTGLIGGSISGYNNVGGIAGYSLNSTVQNCYSTGNISGRNNVGGIVGENNRGTVQNCYARGDVTSSQSFVGGIAGYNDNSGTVQNCYATGTVSGESYAGGITGYNYNSTVQNCYTTSNVNGTSGGLVGGVAGSNNNRIRNCVALNADITLRASNTNIGRITGFNSGTLRNNYGQYMRIRYNWNGTAGTTYTPYDDHTLKDGNDLLDEIPFEDQTWWRSNWTTADGASVWDFTGVWQWNSTTNLPTLRTMPGGEQDHIHFIPVTNIFLTNYNPTVVVNKYTERFSIHIEHSSATNKDVIWSSSNPSVATVTQTGVLTADVTAHSTGTAVIRVTSVDGGMTASYTVTGATYVPISSMRIEPSGIYTQGSTSTRNITAILTPANANQKIKWDISDPSIASFTTSGLYGARVSPRSAVYGKTAITATSDDDKVSAQCKIWASPNDFQRAPPTGSTGTFMMGSSASEGNHDERPQRQVTLTAFNIQRYPVTQELYEWVTGTNPSFWSTADGRAPAAGENAERRPVEQVSWYDALIFCNRLSIMSYLTPVYQINGSTNPDDWGAVPVNIDNAAWNAVEIVSGSTGYRLPTEAQWEFACRAGTTTAYNTGSTISDSTGWYWNNSGSMTHEVGKKSQNAWGLYDMHGNVYEWCWDRYNDKYYSESGNTNNPMGPASGYRTHRVLRGGCFFDHNLLLRSAYRYYSSDDAGYGAPYNRNDNHIGFRIVRP